MLHLYFILIILSKVLKSLLLNLIGLFPHQDNLFLKFDFQDFKPSKTLNKQHKLYKLINYAFLIQFPL